MSPLGRSLPATTLRPLGVEEQAVQQTFGPGAPPRLRQIATAATDSTIGRSLFSAINDAPVDRVISVYDDAHRRFLHYQAPPPGLGCVPATPPPPPPLAHPAKRRSTWDPSARRWITRPLPAVAPAASAASAPGPSALPVTPGRPPDGLLSHLRAQRPAAFNPGIASDRARVPPPSILEVGQLKSLTRRTPQRSSQLGPILLACSMLELCGSLLRIPPAVPSWPRAVERTDPVPKELLAQYKAAFPETFEPATMTAAGDAWLERFGTCWETDQVRHGVSWVWLEFNDGQLGKVHLDNYALSDDPEAAEAIKTEVLKLLKDGRIKDVTDRVDEEGQVIFKLPIFAVKQGNKWRIVWDARELNKHIANESFTMETITEAAKLARPGDYMFTLDMWSGYHQLALREDMRPYCCFEWDGRVYEWQVLPFGLNVAPRTYQKVILKLFGKWRAQGIRCVSYIDDGLWLARSMEEAERIRDIVLADLAELGLIINKDKAQIIPGQAVRFLGYILDTSGPQVRLLVPDDKVERIVAEIEDLLSKKQRRIKGGDLASLLGKILATRYAYTPARPMTRELFACLRQLPLRLMKSEGGQEHCVRDFSRTLKLTDAATLELEFLKRMKDWNGAVWCEGAPSRTLYTDGSSWGFGAVLRRIREGKEDDVLAWTQGEHEMDDELRHSTRTELLAVLEALVAMEGEVRGQTILHRTDNAALHYALVNGGYAVGSNSALNLLIKKVWLVCAILGVRLQSEFVGSAAIIRSGADLLSRQIVQDDRTRLRQEAYDATCDQLGVRPEVDLFADKETRMAGLPFYTMRLNELETPGCQGLDALAQPWRGTCYAFPPLRLVDTVVHKALKEVESGRAEVLLVVPDWGKRTWTALLYPYRSTLIGKYDKVTTQPSGCDRPIESDATWRNTALRAYLLRKQ